MILKRGTTTFNNRTTLDWDNTILYDQSEDQSVNWTSRIAYNGGGTGLFSWFNDQNVNALRMILDTTGLTTTIPASDIVLYTLGKLRFDNIIKAGPTNNPWPGGVNYYGINSDNVLCEPAEWIEVLIDGNSRRIPVYTT